MRTPNQQDVDAAIQALDTVRRGWLRRPNVAAVDVGFRIRGGQLTEEVVLRVHLERKLPEEVVPPHERFDEPVKGIGVDVLQATYAASPLRASFVAPPPPPGTGIQTASADENGEALRRTRVTPLLGGISVGSAAVTAGTLGAIVWGLADGMPHLLSNWHVLAGSEHGCGCCQHHGRSAGQPHYQAVTSIEPHYQAASGSQPHYQAARVGTPIYQPGPVDGGTEDDVIGHLSALRLDRHMDAALARLDGSRPYANDLFGLGPVSGIERNPQLGMRVRKSGRRSGITEGVIDGVSLSTVITFPHGQQSFDDQLHIVPPGPWPEGGPDEEVSDDGDSGAVWVDERTNRAVGLHFAGELDPGPANEHALASPIWRVAEALQFSFTPVPQSAARNPAPPAPPASETADASPAATLAQARRVLEVALKVLED